MRVDMPLDTYELMQAAQVGSMRRISSLKSGLKDKPYTNGRFVPGWSTDIDGAASEMAVSKYLHLYWSGHVNNFAGDDVLGGRQVRSTTHEHGCLIVRPADPDDALFILVVASPPVYSIRGGILGRDAKVDQYWREGTNGEAGAWWVPQHALSELLDEHGSSLWPSHVQELQPQQLRRVGQ
jgi:hypothetical protein